MQTNWGSRPDGDVDNQERTSSVAFRAEVMRNPVKSTKTLIRYAGEVCEKEGQML